MVISCKLRIVHSLCDSGNVKFVIIAHQRSVEGNVFSRVCLFTTGITVQSQYPSQKNLSF